MANRANMPYHLVSFSGSVGIAISFNRMDVIAIDAFHPERVTGGRRFKQDADVAGLRSSCYPQVWAPVPHIMHAARPGECVRCALSLAGVGYAPIHEGHAPGLRLGVTSAFQIVAHPGPPIGANGILLDAYLCGCKGKCFLMYITHFVIFYGLSIRRRERQPGKC